MLRLIPLYAAFALISLAIETAVPHLIPIRGIVPNLLVILAVDLGLRHHDASAALVAFAMGYATDALSGTQLGPDAFMLTAVFIVSYEISLRLMVTNAFIGAMIVLFLTPIAALGSLAMSAGAGAIAWTGPMVPGLAAEAIISAVAAPAVFAMLARCKRAIRLPVHSARE